MHTAKHAAFVTLLLNIVITFLPCSGNGWEFQTPGVLKPMKS
jgi:hypothetical protein